jgi:hypothetical protein
MAFLASRVPALRERCEAAPQALGAAGRRCPVGPWAPSTNPENAHATRLAGARREVELLARCWHGMQSAPS